MKERRTVGAVHTHTHTHTHTHNTFYPKEWKISTWRERVTV